MAPRRPRSFVLRYGMRWLGASIVAVMLASPSVARAGCPNLCEIGEATFTLEPELSCVNVRASSSDCDCGIMLQVGNECELPLDALSFTFRSCGPSSGPTRRDCSELAPAEQGIHEQPIHQLGLNEFRFTLRHDGQDHVLTASAEVSSFDDGALCSVTQGAGRAGASGWAWLFGAVTTAALLRRTRRS
jgi:hypothetical protein